MKKTEELLEAVKEGNLEKVTELLDAGVNINRKNKKGWTALRLACERRHLEIMKLLLDRKANPNTMDLLHTLIFNKPFWSVTERHTEAVKLLLDHGCNPNVKYLKYSVLRWATIEGYTEVVKLLLEYGGKYSGKDKYGYTPFLSAVIHERIDDIKVFLEHGVDPNIKNKKCHNYTPLHYVAKFGSKELIKLLLEYGADKENKCSFNNSTPLMIAMDYDNTEAINLLS